MKAMSAARIDELRDRWDRAVERDRPNDAIAALTELEKLETDEPRWSQRLGEALRRVGKARDAEAAFVRATERYVKQGFLPRAIAMAKLVTSLNPARADLLASLESPKPATPTLPVGAKAPPSGSTKGKPKAKGKAGPPPLPAPRVVPPPLPVMKPVPLQRAQDSREDEVRFSDLEGPSSLDIVMDDFEGAVLEEMVPVSIRDFDVISLPPDAMTPSAVGRLVGSPGAGPTSMRLPVPREPTVDRLGAMATFRFFAGLSREAILELADASELVEHIPGAMIMMRNEPAYALYAIIDGTVRVVVPGSTEVVLGEGDVIGEGCLLEEGRRQADVRAETAVMALRIEKAKLDAVTSHHADLGDALFQLLARRLVTNLMHASPLFTSFEPRVRLELAQLFEIRRAEAGVVLSERGKRSDGLYVLLSGHVNAIGDAGETRIARGTAFGHGTLLGAKPSTVTIETASEAVLLRLPAAKFSALAVSYPPVLALLAETSDELPRASLLPL